MMSSYSLNIHQFPRNPIPVLIYENARKFYNSGLELFGKTLLIIIGVITIPFWYTLLLISIRLTNRKVEKFNDYIKDLDITEQDYRNAYEVYQIISGVLHKFKKDGDITNLQAKNRFLSPLYNQLNRFIRLVEEAVSTLEDKLFQNSDDLGIAQDDLSNLVDQMDKFPHDWDDDDVWSEFQIKHNHLKQ